MPVPFPTFAEPVAEAVIRFESNTGSNYDAVNVMHFQATGVVGDLVTADLERLGASLNRWVSGAAPYAGGYNDAFSDEYSVFDIAVTSEQTDVPGFIIDTFGASGNLTGDLLPREVALVASLRTGFPGPSRRGRTYVPGQTEDVNTNGQPDTTHQALVQDRFEQLVNELPGDTGSSVWALVIASHKNGGLAVVTSVHVDREWDTQRRRGL